MSLDVWIERNDEVVHLEGGWNLWTLQCCALTHAIDNGVVTKAEVDFCENLSDQIDKLNKALFPDDETKEVELKPVQKSDEVHEFESVTITTAFLDDLANTVHTRTSQLWDKVWAHFWDKKTWKRGAHTVLDEYDFRLNLEEDVMGLKAGQKMHLEPGDKIHTNIF